MEQAVPSPSSSGSPAVRLRRRDSGSTVYRFELDAADGAAAARARVPDPFFPAAAYAALRTASAAAGTTPAPLVVDCGSASTRAGWVSPESAAAAASGAADPLLHFATLVGKPRWKEAAAYAGRDLALVEASKVVVRSPFDEDVPYHFGAMESLMDYVLWHLGVDGRMDHPLLLTEPLCMPLPARAALSELLFEAYDTPSVCYGVDALFGLFYNVRRGRLPARALESCMVVRSGHAKTHLIPIVDGALSLDGARRVSVGGFACTDYAQRLLQTKFANLKAFFSWERCVEIKERHCYVAPDYHAELARFADAAGAGAALARTLQLPFNAAAGARPVSQAELERRERLREERSERLREYAARRRQEKRKAGEIEARGLEGAIRSRERQLERLPEGSDAAEELADEIEDLRRRVRRLRSKVDGTPAGAAAAAPASTADEEALLATPDSELTPQQCHLKKRLRMLRNAALGRERMRQRRLAEEEERRRADAEMQSAFESDPQGFLADLKRRRRTILDARAARQRARTPMRVFSSRRQAASRHQRLQALVGVAFAADGDAAEDTFGKNDSDWDVYLKLQKDGEGGGSTSGSGEGPADPEAEEKELADIDRLLARFRPAAAGGAVAAAAAAAAGGGGGRRRCGVGDAAAAHDPAADTQFTLAVERIRIPEILFRPHLAGISQMGVGEALHHSFMSYPAAIRLALAEHIFAVGGCACFPHFADRIRNDVVPILPPYAPVNVVVAADPVADPWRGAHLWVAEEPEAFLRTSVTREQYEEMGHAYLATHFASNLA